MTNQLEVPEALRLAEQYDYGDPATHGNAWKVAVCNELRRQYIRIVELEMERQAVPKASPSDIAKLRHLYANLKNGGVRDTAQAKRIADGLLAPIIERMEQNTQKVVQGEPDPADIIAGALQISRGHAIEMMREALEAAPQQEAQEPVWDGKLSDAMQNALDALYLECGSGITRDITHQVQKECEAIYTSYTTTKRMYQAARDRLELLEAAQPQPDPFAAPQPAPAPLSDDTERLEWLLWKLPGDALRYVVGELADTSSGAEFRAAIDAAIAATNGGKV